MDPPFFRTYLIHDTFSMFSFQLSFLPFFFLFSGSVLQFFLHPVEFLLQMMNITPDKRDFLFQFFTLLLLSGHLHANLIFQNLLPAFQLFQRPIQIDLSIAWSIIICRVIFQFHRHTFAHLCISLAHGNRILITVNIHLSKQHPQIPVLYRKDLSILYTDKLCLFGIFIKISFNTEMFPSACKFQCSGIIIRIVPRFIDAECIILRRSASSPFDSEEHPFDKGMDRRFSRFIFPMDQIDSFFQIDLPVMKFPKVF